MSEHRINAVEDLDGYRLGWYEVVMDGAGRDRFQFYVLDRAGEERTFFTPDIALARRVRDALKQQGETL